MLIGLFAAVLISLSAHTGRVFEAAEGYNAPLFSLSRGDSASVSLADMKGRFVLVKFWSSTDATSRLENRQFDRLAAEGALQQHLSFVSVNLDPDVVLAEEIARRDGLNPDTQWHVEGAEADKIIADYNLDTSFDSYLIDPQGRVIAVNPGRQQILAAIAAE